MRIVSGLYRGKTILPPKNFRARPTTDFAKEAMFNILGNYFNFEEIEVLDLFSGTGSIGYEFASRGALHVEMVEKNFVHSQFIRKTISDLKLNNAYSVKTDAFSYIARNPRSYDIVFADPPYDLEGVSEIPGKIIESQLLKKNGWFILEHGSKYNFSTDKHCFDHRTYGSVHFSFFRQSQDESR